MFIQGSSLSSNTFRVLDSTQGVFGASASSQNYRLLSTIGDVGIGSSSATSFGLRSGSLYYPFIIAPALTSAAEDSEQVDLQWVSGVLDGGWSVSGYNVCTKPSTGIYTCEDVGEVTSFTKTGLSNGTTYTFKVQIKEAFGDVIAESGEIIATPEDAGGGGGGGGGSSGSGSQAPPPEVCGNSADIDSDTRVNLVDFSILAFWWKRLPLPPETPFDLNCDGFVRLDDFSILAFHWSG